MAGDITNLHCDAWLLPTDNELALSNSFMAHLPAAARERLRRERALHDVRTVRLDERAAGPSIWPTAIGADDANDANDAWYMEGIQEFIEAARTSHRNVRTEPGRRPILAVPVVGTGDGGARERSGEIFEVLIPTLEMCAEAGDVDIVLVTRGRAAYAAAQRVRRRLVERAADQLAERRRRWDIGLEGEALERCEAAASELAVRAREGRLTLFVGAGASLASGLPGWADLLQQLAQDLTGGPELGEQLARLDVRDQALVLRDRYRNAGSEMHEALASRLGTAQPSLAHQLLASLPVTEVVTTNFDTLLEHAMEAADGAPISILPAAPAESGRRWLLKLHGSIGEPDSIVFTRDDYLRAPVTHGALLGLVQALLMTRHMLFVGYSLKDEDFHQLIHEIRSALPARRNLGTVLVLEHDELLDELWQQDLSMVPVDSARPSAPGADVASTRIEQGRRVQILLDLVGFLAADLTPFVLAGDEYSALLSEDEKNLKSKLEALVTVIESTDGSFTEPLRATLKRYGWRAEH